MAPATRPAPLIPTSDRLMRATSQALGGARTVGVMHVAVQGLDTMTDAHGDAVGEAIVRTLAERVHTSGTAGQAVAVSRIGHRTFGLLLMGSRTAPLDRAAVERAALSLLGAVRSPLCGPDGVAFRLTATIGAALATGGSAETLHRQAALALHGALARGPERIEFYERARHVAVADRLTLAADLCHAVLSDAFALEYQPIVSLADGATVAAEALVRWQHPTRGRLGPVTFIPEAERSGHITHIGRYVLEEAAWQAVAWHRQLGEQAPSVSVNVSARQLDEHLVDVVEEVLEDTGLAPHRLTLELTESAVPPEGPERLRRRLLDLRELGVRLALDDFGAGYSALASVAQLPLDVLKIDRTFVQLAETPRGQAIVRAVLEVARSMELVTVIEGIERPEQRDRFEALGCDRAQGYLFGRATEPADLVIDLPDLVAC